MNPNIVRTQMRKMRRFEEKYKTGKMSREELNAKVRTVLGMIRGRVNTYSQCRMIEAKWKKITGSPQE